MVPLINDQTKLAMDGVPGPERVAKAKNWLTFQKDSTWKEAGKSFKAGDNIPTIKQGETAYISTDKIKEAKV